MQIKKEIKVKKIKIIKIIFSIVLNYLIINLWGGIYGAGAGLSGTNKDSIENIGLAVSNMIIIGIALTFIQIYLIEKLYFLWFVPTVIILLSPFYSGTKFFSYMIIIYSIILILAIIINEIYKKFKN